MNKVTEIRTAEIFMKKIVTGLARMKIVHCVQENRSSYQLIKLTQFDPCLQEVLSLYFMAHYLSHLSIQT